MKLEIEVVQIKWCIRSVDAVSILDYGHAVAKANDSKACGLDGIALSIARAHRRPFIRAQYPLILKKSLCISEPVQSKGGELLACLNEDCSISLTSRR